MNKQYTPIEEMDFEKSWLDSNPDGKIEVIGQDNSGKKVDYPALIEDKDEVSRSARSFLLSIHNITDK